MTADPNHEALPDNIVALTIPGARPLTPLHLAVRRVPFMTFHALTYGRWLPAPEALPGANTKGGRKSTVRFLRGTPLQGAFLRHNGPERSSLAVLKTKTSGLKPAWFAVADGTLLQHLGRPCLFSTARRAQIAAETGSVVLSARRVGATLPALGLLAAELYPHGHSYHVCDVIEGKATAFGACSTAFDRLYGALIGCDDFAPDPRKAFPLIREQIVPICSAVFGPERAEGMADIALNIVACVWHSGRGREVPGLRRRVVRDIQLALLYKRHEPDDVLDAIGGLEPLPLPPEDAEVLAEWMLLSPSMGDLAKRLKALLMVCQAEGADPHDRVITSAADAVKGSIGAALGRGVELKPMQTALDWWTKATGGPKIDVRVGGPAT
jgi:hypothetical protein